MRRSRQLTVQAQRTDQLARATTEPRSHKHSQSKVAREAPVGWVRYSGLSGGVVYSAELPNVSNPENHGQTEMLRKGASCGPDNAMLPKRQSMKRVTQARCNAIAKKLNTRPRKRLGYRTPEEVFYGE